MSIREYGEEGPRPRHLVCQRLELGPRSLQNREIRPAPPGSPVQGRSSQSWKVLLHSRPPSTVLPRGGDPPGGRAGRQQGEWQWPECPWTPLTSTQRPLGHRVQTGSQRWTVPAMGPGSACETPTQAGPWLHGPFHVLLPQEEGTGALGGEAGACPPWRQKRILAQVPRRPMDLKMNTELLRAASGPPPPAAVLPVKCGLNRTHGPEEGAAAGVGAPPRACRATPRSRHRLSGPQFPRDRLRPGWTLRLAGPARPLSAAPPCSSVRPSLRNGAALGRVRGSQNEAAAVDMGAASHVKT